MTGRYNTGSLRDRWGDHATTLGDGAWAIVATSLAVLACEESRHRTETDPEIGDEVCRYCKEVIE